MGVMTREDKIAVLQDWVSNNCLTTDNCAICFKCLNELKEKGNNYV